MHKSLLHKGKIPARMAKKQLYEARLKDLNNELQRAIQSERYEEAATLRDQISQIEEQLKA
jgi:protein arginine kinase activator